ncbi:MAG: CvpA family protein [Gemmatimonadetes bacterium]|nr:CvpA family protein [Gemmatimonadota bacterium]
MNWVDILIVTVTAIAVLTGIFRGAVKTVFSVAGIIIGFFVASRESGSVGVLLSKWMREDLAAVAGFVLVLFGIAAVVTLAGFLLRKVMQGLLLGWVDRVAGAALGFLQAAVAVGVLALVVEGYGSFPTARKSITYPYALQAGRFLLEVIPEDTLERLHWKRLRLPGASDDADGEII